jgi:site-specific DNA-methyltransferase (adenine-specific)
MMELNKIYCGDNCDLLGQLPRECIDLVVTSPPYDDLRTYGGHTWDFYGVAWQLKRVLKPGGVIVWVVADATKDGSETGTSMEQALHFKRLGLSLHDTMIYQKQFYVPLTHNRYEQEFEYMFVFSKGQPKSFNPKKVKTLFGGQKSTLTHRKTGEEPVRGTNYGEARKEERIIGNVWLKQPARCSEHPAVFPDDLATDHISSWSNPGDLVLDPFTGSGTTCKAAKELGRNFLGFEINPEYCKIAERRIAQEVLDFAS